MFSLEFSISDFRNHLAAGSDVSEARRSGRFVRGIIRTRLLPMETILLQRTCQNQNRAHNAYHRRFEILSGHTPSVYPFRYR